MRTAQVVAAAASGAAAALVGGSLEFTGSRTPALSRTTDVPLRLSDPREDVALHDHVEPASFTERLARHEPAGDVAAVSRLAVDAGGVRGLVEHGGGRQRGAAHGLDAGRVRPRRVARGDASAEPAAARATIDVVTTARLTMPAVARPSLRQGRLVSRT